MNRTAKTTIVLLLKEYDRPEWHFLSSLSFSLSRCRFFSFLTHLSFFLTHFLSFLSSFLSFLLSSFLSFLTISRAHPYSSDTPRSLFSSSWQYNTFYTRISSIFDFLSFFQSLFSLKKGLIVKCLSPRHDHVFRVQIWPLTHPALDVELLDVENAFDHHALWKIELSSIFDERAVSLHPVYHGWSKILPSDKAVNKAWRNSALLHGEKVFEDTYYKN